MDNNLSVVKEVLTSVKLPSGTDLWQRSFTQPLLLIFLRHKGCTFCRETLHEAAKMKNEFLVKNVLLVFIHMSEPEVGKEFIESYGINNYVAVSDPEKKWYRAFDLPRGTLNQLFGPKVWLRGFQAGVSKGLGIGAIDGDGFQMPGIFLLESGKVIKAYHYQTAGDVPPFRELLS